MAKIKLAMIAREIELCECEFVTIVIDIVHKSAISDRRKGLIGSIEYFRLISADSTLPYCFSASVTVNGILTPQSRERGKMIGAQVRQTPFRIVSPLGPSGDDAIIKRNAPTQVRYRTPDRER